MSVPTAVAMPSLPQAPAAPSLHALQRSASTEEPPR